MLNIRNKYTMIAGISALLIPGLAWVGWLLTGAGWGMALGGLAGAACTPALFYLFTGSMERAINIFRENGNKIIRGDLTVAIDVNTGDELQILSQNTVKLAQGVGYCLAEVEKHNSKLLGQADHILNSTSQVSAGTQDQATQVQDLLNGIEKLAGGANHWASQASTAAEGSRRTDNSAREGESTLNRVRGNMELINQRMTELGESSNRIGQITTTIDDIAAQTNLLALNAAIEAARAGSNGRGFAVVAEEVRKLAENSAAAAREIASLVGAIQAGTGGALQVVEQGIQVTRQAGEAFKTITGLVDQTVSLSEGLAKIAAEQASVTENMVDRTQAISAVVEETTAISEETLARSQELAAVTKELEKLTKIFKFKKME